MELQVMTGALKKGDQKGYVDMKCLGWSQVGWIFREGPH